MNTIPEDQNSNKHLNQLGAASQFHLKGKRLVLLENILTLLIPLLSFLINQFFDTFKPYAALYGILIAIIDPAVFERLRRDWIIQAAKIKELFDCQVLRLEWDNLVAGDQPGEEIIVEEAEHFKRNQQAFAKLKNWYPEIVGELPLCLARLACQRANFWWTSRLRSHYSVGIYIAGALMLIVIIVVGLAEHMTLEEFVISILAPLTPLFQTLIREYYKQREIISSFDNLMVHATRLWNGAINKQFSVDHLDKESRRLQ